MPRNYNLTITTFSLAPLRNSCPFQPKPVVLNTGCALELPRKLSKTIHSWIPHPKILIHLIWSEDWASNFLKTLRESQGWEHSWNGGVWNNCNKGILATIQSLNFRFKALTRYPLQTFNFPHPQEPPLWPKMIADTWFPFSSDEFSGSHQGNLNSGCPGPSIIL